jgi:hypothetical protein
MVDVTRALLDELMGKQRDAPLDQRSNRKIAYSDPDVCKHELVSVCPNQLFKNTRSDLGELVDESGADGQLRGSWRALQQLEWGLARGTSPRRCAAACGAAAAAATLHKSTAHCQQHT